ncbi:tRNA (guanosine(46)-N7)-methyltransferase TrmB [bacterium]|nr:tRNA (guanosine(46)-N7)-methyltransferase TrmB [bacterium]
MGRRTVRKPADYDQRKEKFLINVEEDIILDFVKIFGNNNPVHIEIGSGKGEFISQKCRENRDINYIGIELNPHRITSIMKKLDLAEDTNVKLLNHYVDKNIIKVIPQYSIPVIYIQHPDPWPKRRHHKYRLINQPFIDALSLMLTPEGKVEIATDHPGYSEWIIEHFQERVDFKALFENGFSFERQAGHIETYFEEVKRAEGFEPRFMFYQKLNQLKR